MPELPEISLYKNYLTETSLNKKIKKIDFLYTGVLQAPKSEFETTLKGEEFKVVHRLGKYLIVETSGKMSLVLHFGMTGKLDYFRNQEAPKYSRVIFSFDGDEHLAFVCRRKLGKLFLARTPKAFRESHELGEDALEVSEEEFLELLNDKAAAIKIVLTDQHVVAGIGNVYCDEMLYQCKIHPKTKTNSLSESEKKKLYHKMREVLEMAIALEGERSAFPKDYLISHRKGGADCPECKGKVKKISVSGRSTYFCPSCQEKND